MQKQKVGEIQVKKKATSEKTKESKQTKQRIENTQC